MLEKPVRAANDIVACIAESNTHLNPNRGPMMSRLATKAIVVFTSDHGNCLGTHHMVSKDNPYEESMRVPFLIRWSGKINPRQDDLLLSTPDIYPTLLDLMGLAEKIPQEVEGSSYASIFKTGQGARPSSQLYIYVPVGEAAFGMRGVRTYTHKLVLNKEKSGSMQFTLYDRIQDPYELINSADEQPEIVRRIIADELVPWLQKTADPWLDSGLVNIL